MASDSVRPFCTVSFSRAKIRPRERSRVELPQTESALETGTPAPSMVDI